jgi:hypothetical protein
VTIIFPPLDCSVEFGANHVSNQRPPKVVVQIQAAIVGLG